ncbi:hypothetical protein TNCV_982321 [Trichonephila clavipes]|nr:hypothetical protein TNCV_982321 [Trichonephila clavipes]
MQSDTVLQICQGYQPSSINKIFKYSHCQKSQGLRSGERGGHAVGNARLFTLSLVKFCRRNCCTQSPMCGGSPSCMKVIESRHWCCSIWGATKFSKMFLLPPGRHGAGHRAIASSLFEKERSKNECGCESTPDCNFR